jgi:hypothetical protein
MPIAVKMLPLKGIFKLCKKLPKTISEAAQKVPIIEAFSHFSFIILRFIDFVLGIRDVKNDLLLV